MDLPLRIDEIREACRGKLIRGKECDLVFGVSTDTRTIVKGELFVALKGANFDGHDFVNDAYQKGALGAIVSNGFEFPNENFVNLILVGDTLEALGSVASVYRGKFDVPMVAITGSNGKTTTKEMTASVLAQKFEVLKSESSLNNRIGIPMTIFKLCKKHEVGVLELGTSLWGEIPALSRTVKPKVGVITNVGPTHLEGFGSVERVAAEKAAILDFAKYAVLNFDDPLVSKMKDNFRGKVVGFGISKTKSGGLKAGLARVDANHPNLDKDGRVDFEILVDGLNYGKVQLPGLGFHNIHNALAAVAVGFIFGLNQEEVKAGLESYEPPKMRMQGEEIDGVRFINDAYNANPVSIKGAIEFLNRLEAAGKKVAVFGSMAELGENSRGFHREVGEVCSRSKIGLLICLGNEGAHIALAAVENGFPEESAFVCDSSNQASLKLHQWTKPGDVVLIKGSRSMRMEEVIEGFREKRAVSCSTICTT